MLALVQFARGRAAVAHQQYADGYDHLRRVRDASDVAYHPFVGSWGLSDPVDAAWQVGVDALAFDGLAAAAEQELRASGEASRRRTPDARDRLTSQELQIAQLVAEGFSNREIGQRLYLSHRTVGSHLYRMFPKLGITSRAQLVQALAVAAGEISPR
jgi:DNA-binding CsgD family transcriptional regulator